LTLEFRRRLVSETNVFETLLLQLPSYDIPHQAPDISLGVLRLFALLSISGLPCCHFCNCRQGIDSQQHPALSK
jgi:hypothetical protein